VLPNKQNKAALAARREPIELKISLTLKQQHPIPRFWEKANWCQQQWPPQPTSQTNADGFRMYWGWHNKMQETNP
jgi:hypothetical protein